MIQTRSIPLCIVLSFLTCGLYPIYWFVVMTTESDIVAEKEGGLSGLLSLLLLIVTCGIFHFVWIYQLGEKLDYARSRNDEPRGNLGILYLVLCCFGLSIVSYALAQNELNKYA